MSTIPTVYFIDDSATMREVIKIAFRRENINVVACHDAATALAEIETARPDIVITDVIMPDKDGYDVCQHIKSHPSLAKTPVILMSGVVNRAVAERAFAVKADELLRKPFQPQDLIARVKHLLKPNGTPPPTPTARPTPRAPATSLFPGPTRPTAPRSVPAPAPPAQRAVAASVPAPVIPLPVAPGPAATAIPAAAPGPAGAPNPSPALTPAMAHPAPAPPAPVAKSATSGDPAKLKIEILRLGGLVKKPQSELQAEREYARALEAHVKTLQEAD